MSDSDADKTMSISDADSKEMYEESSKKRRLSDSTESSSVSPECKRLCSVTKNTPGSSDRDEDGAPKHSTESEDSLSIPGKKLTKIASLDLPPKLNKWERKHIENLNISIVYAPNTKPLDLIQCGEIKNYEETEKIIELKKYIQKSPIMANLRSLDHVYTSFSELSSKSLWEMAPDEDKKLSLIPAWVPEQHMIWFYRYTSNIFYMKLRFLGGMSLPVLQNL